LLTADELVELYEDACELQERELLANACALCRPDVVGELYKAELAGAGAQVTSTLDLELGQSRR
jgi:hypothetical protein